MRGLGKRDWQDPPAGSVTGLKGSTFIRHRLRFRSRPFTGSGRAPVAQDGVSTQGGDQCQVERDQNRGDREPACRFPSWVCRVDCFAGNGCRRGHWCQRRRAGEAAWQRFWTVRVKGAEPTGVGCSMSLREPAHWMRERGSPASRSDKEHDLTPASHGRRQNGRKSISASWPSGRPPRQADRGDSGDVLESLERDRCLRPRIIPGLHPKVIASGQGSGRCSGQLA